MPKSPGEFDPVGIVVDWIDACRHRDLSALVELYDDAASSIAAKAADFAGEPKSNDTGAPN